MQSSSQCPLPFLSDVLHNKQILTLSLSSEVHLSGDRILIVDDNISNLKMIRLVLRTEGYEIRTASDSEEALAVLENFQPRLILMDIQLPGMDGLELTQKLKAAPDTRDIIVVAFTAYAMKGDEEKALAAGCDGYVTKPIDTRTFPALVARFLEGGVASASEAAPSR